MRDHGAWLAVVGGNIEFTHGAIDRDAADAVAGGFAEPQSAVADDDRERLAAGRNAAFEFGDGAIRRDAADLADFRFGEPDITVRPERNAVRSRVFSRQRKFGERATRSQAADLV